MILERLERRAGLGCGIRERVFVVDAHPRCRRLLPVAGGRGRARQPGKNVFVDARLRRRELLVQGERLVVVSERHRRFRRTEHRGNGQISGRTPRANRLEAGPRVLDA